MESFPESSSVDPGICKLHLLIICIGIKIICRHPEALIRYTIIGKAILKLNFLCILYRASTGGLQIDLSSPKLKYQDQSQKIAHICAFQQQTTQHQQNYAYLSHYPCSFPVNYPASAKSSISQPLLIRIQPNLKLKLP